MPRRARIAVPGIPWHIIQRGNNRSACFYAQADHRVHLETLRQQAREFGCAVHTYVLMTNDVNWLISPAEKPLESDSYQRKSCIAERRIHQGETSI